MKGMKALDAAHKAHQSWAAEFAQLQLDRAIAETSLEAARHRVKELERTLEGSKRECGVAEGGFKAERDKAKRLEEEHKTLKEENQKLRRKLDVANTILEQPARVDDALKRSYKSAMKEAVDDFESGYDMGITKGRETAEHTYDHVLDKMQFRKTSIRITRKCWMLPCNKRYSSA